MNFSPTFGIASLTRFDYSASASDTDGDPLTFTWDVAGNASSGASGAITFAPPGGSGTARVTVSDGKGGTATDTRQFTVGSASGTWRGTWGQWIFTSNLTQNNTTLTGDYSDQLGPGRLDPAVANTIDANGNVQETRFEEKQREIPKEEMKALEDDYTVTVKKGEPPAVPGVRANQALVVVVCPAVDTADTGRGSQYRLYANGKIIAVNRMGTHNFVFLDPGRYTLMTKAGNAGELTMDLEAGKDYYFFQNTFMGFASTKNTLTRQSKELVTYELTGTYPVEWQPKVK
jgi:hypothetical protein